MPVDKLQSLLDVKFFTLWHYTKPGVDIFVKKNKLVMNWHIFLGHEYSIYNAIVTHLIALNTLKNQKFVGLCPHKLNQGSAPDLKLQLQLLHNCFVLHKALPSSKKRH